MAESASDSAALTDELARTRSLFALAERAAGTGYWRFDFKTSSIDWSDGLYALFGIDRSQPRQPSPRWLVDFIRPEDMDDMQRCIAEALRSGAPFSYRMRARDPAAAIQAIETRGEIERDEHGKPVALIGVCRDISRQSAAEAVGRRAEEWYRCMADQASDIIILYDADGRVLYASQALQRLLGRAEAAVDGDRYLDLIHPEDRDCAASLVLDPSPGKTTTATYRAQHGEGHYVWIEATIRGVFDETGTLQNFISVSRDITERKRREAEASAARDRAVAANLAKSTFLANMSHELRTPLNAIIGFAEIMKQELFGPVGCDQYRDYSRLIHESGELLLDLISDVLDMAKIEAGKLELHIEALDLPLLVSDCTRLVEERARQNDVRLVTALTPAVSELAADRRALKQILLNLLSNAVKFSLPGGCVTVRSEATPAGLALSVADEGVGIPAEDLPRLGRPFEQAKTDATLSAGGAGLGLALVRALAEKHGGEMRIDSTEGVGTTVTVWLPLQPAAKKAVA